jgi:steroid 5-alpha reductase family enzyme
MRMSSLYEPMNDPPLTQRTDFFWRVFDLSAATVAPALLAFGLSLPAYALLALLVSTWSSRFVWAAIRVYEARAKGEARSLERMSMRGSHLALALALYMSAVQDNPLLVYFLAGVMALISLERVMFSLRREHVEMVTDR